MNHISSMLAEIRPEFDYEESENFIEDGMLDSFDIISLINMVEEKYHVRIDGLDIVPENFASLDAIAGLIRKSGGNI